MADNAGEVGDKNVEAPPQEENHVEPAQEAVEEMAIDEDIEKGETDAASTTKSSSDDESFKFLSTIDEFGYYFNKEGKLLSKDKNEEFVFKLKNDMNYNQKRYEALGEVITEHVYQLLEKEVNMKRYYIPVDAKDDELKGFIYVTDDVETNKRLMVLINGSGVVRAGQWARRLIINDCLDSGTMLPYIKKAKEEGYAVLIMNTNQNYQSIDGDDVPIRGSESPEAHAYYVWKNIIKNLPARQIAVVAHSYGGRVTTYLVDQLYEDFKERVFAIAFTDSVHFIQDVEKIAAANYLRKYAKNWVTSDLPLDEEIEPFPEEDDVPKVSAGHIKHENTSWSSFTSVFKFIQEKLSAQNEKDEL